MLNWSTIYNQNNGQIYNLQKGMYPPKEEMENKEDCSLGSTLSGLLCDVFVFLAASTEKEVKQKME